MGYLANRLGDANDLGIFIDEAALNAAYPIGAPGYFAIVETTDSFWIWDSGTSAWIDSGRAAAEAYLYIAYASDDIGTGFTLTFDPLLDYIAVLSSTVAIPAPAVGDFAGLWKNYKGQPGPGGDVVGPATNTDGYIPQWDGANSKTLKNGIDPATLLTTTTGANAALSNLASVAINTSLVSDTDNTDDLGTTLKKWANLFVTTIGATATRVTKGWFTDIESTNIPTVNGGTLASALNLSGTNTGDNAANSSTHYIGTTAVALNRASADLALTGITSVNALPISKGNSSVATNVAVGTSALNLNTTGSSNTAVGNSAMATNLTGNYNSAFGSSAMANVKGSSNTGVGNNSLGNITTGGTNTAIGKDSLLLTQTKSGSVAVGYSAGKYSDEDNAFYVDNQDRTNTAGDKAGALLYGTFNATPSLQTLTVNGDFTVNGKISVPQYLNFSADNVFSGLDSGQYLKSVSGSQFNTMIGVRAGQGSTVSTGTADYNTGVGANSIRNITTGANNSALGYNTLSKTTSGANNSALGYNTLSNLTSGANNTAFGRDASIQLVSGNNNVSVGNDSLYRNVSGSGNIGLGNYAGFFELGSNSFYLNNRYLTDTAGDKAYSLLYGTFGTGASTVGQTLTVNGDFTVNGKISVPQYLNFSADNVFSGLDSGKYLKSVSGSQFNTMIGVRAGQGSTVSTGTADYNTGVGANSIRNITTGANNSALGYNTLSKTTSGANNSALGYNTLSNLTSGANNTAFGRDASIQLVSGNNNVSVGNDSLYRNVSGSGNIGLGNYAGFFELGSNSFYLNNRYLTDTAGDKAYSLLYGTFGTGASTVGQTLTVNGTLSTSVAGTAAGSVATIDGTQTLTNKRINPRLVTAASYTTDTGTSLDVSTCDQFEITAQAGALKFNNPGGTAVGGQKLIIRIKDNGTAQALTYDTEFRAMGVALPSTTVLSKTLYLGLIFNATDTKWDLIAAAQEE